MATPNTPRKIVLAYSGGLDTSVILPWLKDRYPGVKLVAYAADLGQGPGELEGIEDKALRSGADEVIVDDFRQEFAEQYCFPMLRAHAIYEQDYLLGTSIARPLIAKGQVEAARMVGLPPSHIVRRIQIPQMLGLVVPPSVNQIIILVKESAVLSIITVGELTMNATRMANETFAVVEPFLAIALLYWLLIELIARSGRWIERRVRHG